MIFIVKINKWRLDFNSIFPSLEICCYHLSSFSFDSFFFVCFSIKNDFLKRNETRRKQMTSITAGHHVVVSPPLVIDDTICLWYIFESRHRPAPFELRKPLICFGCEAKFDETHPFQASTQRRRNESLIFQLYIKKCFFNLARVDFHLSFLDCGKRWRTKKKKKPRDG